MSVLYYLQSLCPVPAPMGGDAPLLIRLLAAPAAPASRPGAILGLLLLTALVLWIARGKTDWEIARILGVSHVTVIEHVRHARERYGAPTRVTQGRP